eukprot:TRINITY_DN22305_c0_g1_i1.p1 TRINITY_DN22305_c0_g1~~TRINITY_DN22305_c0_g1_i1.p1  ORF type:complete len:662 (+),score=72.06 TRINITY_DN22305_c0_g1_i1:36-1988(+)
MAEAIIELRNKGNQATAKGDLEDAEKLYTQSIEQWDGDECGETSVEAVKSFANRAACRLMMKKYQEGKEDALRCLEIQPCYARAMMLVGQLQWEICKESGTPLDAYVWPFVSACSLDERYLTEVLRSGILTSIADARGKQASLIQNTSKYTPPYSVVQGVGGERSGRSLRAVRDISPGEIIIPFQVPVVLGSDKPLEICKRCGKEVKNSFQACKRCKVTVYCSKDCKGKDEGLHASECAAVSACGKVGKVLNEKKNSFGVSLGQLYDMGYLEEPSPESADDAVDVDDLMTTVVMSVGAVFRLAKLFESPKENLEVNWRDVIELEAHAHCVDLKGTCSRAPVNHAAWKISSEIMTTLPAETTPSITAMLETIDFIPDIDSLLRHVVCLLQTNSFEVGEGMALVANPLAYVNHSCTPNAARNETGVLRACCHIKKGEEITTAYIADLMQNRARRRDALMKLQGFACGCVRCSQGSGWPLADVLKCGCGGWVGVPEGTARRCSSCGKVTTYEEAAKVVDPLCEEVEKVAPVLHGSISALGEVDTELLDKLLMIRDAAHARLHPLHWLSHRIHSYLISPLLLLSHSTDAATHSLYALAAMDATLQPHWLGKADRAQYISEHYPTDDGAPTYLKTIYTKAVLKGMSESLRTMGLN